MDFQTIDALDLPFRLGYKLHISSGAIRNEMLSPPGIAESMLVQAYLCTD